MSHSFVVTPDLKQEAINRYRKPDTLLNAMSDLLGLKPPSWAGGDREPTLNQIEACGGTAAEVWSVSCNPFIATINMAYDRHIPLALKPDDIWLVISNGFATHINQDPEKYRRQFVQHEGKKTIELRRDEFRKGSLENDWVGAFDEFSEQIKKNVGKKHDLLVANFTTTGPIEKAASELVLMNTVQAYFKYGMSTLCGFPKITLLGEVTDWLDLHHRASVLAEFDLAGWVERLLPTLMQFLNAASGKPDITWWESFYKKGGGSGGPYINGYINTLFPYLNGGRGGIVPNPYLKEDQSTSRAHMGHGATTDSYPLGIARTPFYWKYFGETYPMELIGGHVGVDYEPSTNELKPAIGWAVRELEEWPEGDFKPDPEEMEEKAEI